MKTFGFIGCGNMGGALAKAVSAAGYKGDILLADKDIEKAEALAETAGAEVCGTERIASECRYIFIGVKPQVIEACLSEIREIISKRDDCVAVSMAAGVSVEKIRLFSDAKHIIRIMPNLPVALGKGVVLAADSNVSEKDRSVFSEAMSKAGVFDWIDEKLIDAASAVSGCGPAFVYMFIEALSDGAVMCGLPRDKAMLYAAGMLEGAAEMVLKSGKHPGKLKDEVCSPGGTTIAGVKALEDGAMRSAVINAVKSAYDKTVELGR